MLAFWGNNEALKARKSADCTNPLKNFDTLIEQSVILIPYRGLFSRGANFPEFPEWTHDSGKFILSQFSNSFSGGSRGFEGFHGNPLLKFIYSNRAVRSILSNKAVGLRCSNYYCSFIRNHLVINVKYCWERSMKVDDLFGLQLNLSWRFCQAETETPFQKSGLRHWVC